MVSLKSIAERKVHQTKKECHLLLQEKVNLGHLVPSAAFLA
jgi:hypothetical protein